MQTKLATECNQIHRHTIGMAKFNKDIEFSNRFRKLVADKGWGELNRIDLGKKIGTSSTCATFYMNGDRLPAIDQARIISKLFNVCVEWLLTGKGPMRPGEENAHPLHKEIAALSPEQQAEVANFVQFVASKTTNKPLTKEPDNVGGGLIARQKPAAPQSYSGTVPLQESIATTRRLQHMSTREQEAAGTYLCPAERRAIEHRVDEAVRTNSALNWTELRSSFVDRLPHDENDNQPQQSE